MTQGPLSLLERLVTLKIPISKKSNKPWVNFALLPSNLLSAFMTAFQAELQYGNLGKCPQHCWTNSFRYGKTEVIGAIQNEILQYFAARV